MFTRNDTKQFNIGNLKIGGGADVLIQSMLSIPANDIAGNIKQAKALEQAGCQIIRTAVPDMDTVKLVEKLNPDYRYISDSNSRERIHKFNLRKKTLHNKYGFPIDLTEKEMAEKLGLYKIWNCGLYKYEWNKKREE